MASGSLSWLGFLGKGFRSGYRVDRNVCIWPDSALQEIVSQTGRDANGSPVTPFFCGVSKTV
jgi:hypothetical protein